MNSNIVAPEVLNRFFLTLPGTSLAQQLRATSLGVFVPEEAQAELVRHYQRWLKSDTAASEALDSERSFEHLFGRADPSQYYLLDGKACRIGSVANLEISQELKGKLPAYGGTPIDARNSIHPKDPMLANLPAGIKVQQSSEGLQLGVQIGGVELKLSLGQLSELGKLISHSPRLRRFRHVFKLSLRKSLVDIAAILRHSRPLPLKALGILPSRFRHRSDTNFLRLSDLIFVLTRQGNLLFAFGLKGRNLMEFVRQEIQELQHSVRSKRIGEFDLRGTDGKSAGVLRTKTDKFFVDYPALMDFVQIWRPQRNDKGAHSLTLFDYIRALSEEFQNSAWTLERDIPPRLRARRGEPVNYRCSRNWIFWTSKRNHITALRRKPMIRSEQKAPT